MTTRLMGKKKSCAGAKTAEDEEGCAQERPGGSQINCEGNRIHIWERALAGRNWRRAFRFVAVERSVVSGPPGGGNWPAVRERVAHGPARIERTLIGFTSFEVVPQIRKQ